MSRPHGGWPAVQELLAGDTPRAKNTGLPRTEVARLQGGADAHDLVTWPEAPLRYVPFPAAHP